jgi:Nucleotidyl transferase AbiEii toxin, Type IV TA system
VTAEAHQTDWARLFRVARGLIRQVNAKATIIDNWSFGGGTAMMLQIHHRESRDVDLFLQDPQLLPFLDPRTHDFEFEIRPSGCDGDGARFLKIAFENIGEIDFIVSLPKTSKPTTSHEIEGERVQLETVPEIICKKIVQRGLSVRPRDIFDIAAAGEKCGDEVVAELRAYRKEVELAISALGRLNPAFVNEAISQLIIRDEFCDVAKTAIERARRVLLAV